MSLAHFGFVQNAPKERWHRALHAASQIQVGLARFAFGYQREATETRLNWTDHHPLIVLVVPSLRTVPESIKTRLLPRRLASLRRRGVWRSRTRRCGRLSDVGETRLSRTNALNSLDSPWFFSARRAALARNGRLSS